MNKVLQQVLKLGTASAAKEWLEVESLVLKHSKNLGKSELIEITTHYADNHQGTENFWKSMSTVVEKQFSSYTADDINCVFHAFAEAGTKYEFSDVFVSNMLRGLKFSTNEFAKMLKEQDPTFEDNVYNALKEEKDKFDQLEDPELEFMDDLKSAEQNPEKKQENEKIREFVKAWQDVIKNL